MTLNEFLRELSITKCTFYISTEADHQYGFIRADNGRCPIEAVAGRFGAFPAGRELGLTNHIIERIVTASDDKRRERSLRKRILKAVGL